MSIDGVSDSSTYSRYTDALQNDASKGLLPKISKIHVQVEIVTPSTHAREVFSPKEVPMGDVNLGKALKELRRQNAGKYKYRTEGYGPQSATYNKQLSGYDKIQLDKQKDKLMREMNPLKTSAQTSCPASKSSSSPTFLLEEICLIEEPISGPSSSSSASATSSSSSTFSLDDISFF